MNLQKISSWFQLLILVGSITGTAWGSAWYFGGKVATLASENNQRDEKIKETRDIAWTAHDLLLRVDTRVDTSLQRIEKSLERLENLAMGRNQTEPWAPYWGPGH